MTPARRKEIEDEIVELLHELGVERSLADRNSAAARDLEHRIAALEAELTALAAAPESKDTPKR